MCAETKTAVSERVLYNGEYCGRIVAIHINEDPNSATGIRTEYVIKIEEEYKDIKYPYITLREDELNCSGPYTIDKEG